MNSSLFTLLLLLTLGGGGGLLPCGECECEQGFCGDQLVTLLLLCALLNNNGCKHCCPL